LRRRRGNGGGILILVGLMSMIPYFGWRRMIIHVAFVAVGVSAALLMTKSPVYSPPEMNGIHHGVFEAVEL
jgi:hypothetical protein